jgi:hypothetical protein
MSHHCRLHHTVFPKLITMAENGEIPKRLAALKGRCPICVVCLFGQAHKRPWQSKSKQKHPIRKPTDDAPGKKASLDQMVSAQRGLILQMSECLTNFRRSFFRSCICVSDEGSYALRDTFGKACL